MAYELDNSNDNLVLLDDVVVEYAPGFRDAAADEIHNARARTQLRAETEKNANRQLSLAQRTDELESRADTADGQRQNFGSAIDDLKAESETTQDTLSSLSQDTLDLTNRVADNESGAKANSRAIEQTRSLSEINRDRIRAESGRFNDYRVRQGAINLVRPPGQPASQATDILANGRATESVRVITERNEDEINVLGENVVLLSGELESVDKNQRATANALDATNIDVSDQGDTLRSYGDRLQTLDAQYRDQQGQISNKASQSRVDEVEADAERARSTLSENLRAEFNSALDNQDLSNYATLDRVAEVESSAESARSNLQTTLSSQIGDNSAAIQNTAETVDGISAQQVFKTEANGVVAGLGLASGPTGPDGVTQSRIYLAADTIAFVTDRTVTPTQETLTTPFVVQDTPDGTGQVLINSALIGRAQITDAMIDRVSANKVIADDLSAISANLGTVTAGTYKTRNSGKRLEISSTGIPFWFGDGAKSVGNALTCIEADGTFHSRSATSGARLEYDDDHISVFDENGRERVRMGRIS